MAPIWVGAKKGRIVSYSRVSNSLKEPEVRPFATLWYYDQDLLLLSREPHEFIVPTGSLPETLVFLKGNRQ